MVKSLSLVKHCKKQSAVCDVEQKTEEGDHTDFPPRHCVQLIENHFHFLALTVNIPPRVHVAKVSAGNSGIFLFHILLLFQEAPLPESPHACLALSPSRGVEAWRERARKGGGE